MSNIVELKKNLQKYNHLVSNISKLKKKDLENLNCKLREYEEQKKDYDYHQFTFNGKAINISEDQYQIVTCPKNTNIRVLACAGSGKTTTIICRIKYLIDSGVLPERIMLTTFNVDAAENMKKRLKELFGFMPKVCIGTIDSISCKFYHRYCPRDTFIGVSEYSSEFLNFLKSSEGYQVLNSFSYIFFDEFQDVNQIQYQILMCFYENGTKITVIGDDAQNIYQFRGSNVHYIIDLKTFVPDLTTFKLLTNYRSTPEIIKFANESIRLNQNQIKKDMLPIHKSIKAPPLIKYYQSIKEQVDDLLKSILKFKTKGFKEHDIAIICRNNSPLKIIEERLEKHNSSDHFQRIAYVSLITEDADCKPKVRPGHLSITTIHKSKGLEWNIVFFIGCDDDAIPSKKDNLSLEEERRLFYVATTRAKEYLYISFAKKRQKIPFITRFIQEIPTSCYDFPDKDPQFFRLSDKDNIPFEMGVTKIIKLFQDQDIVYLRQQGIVPYLTPEITIIHPHAEVDKKIQENYWEADFGLFVDTFITREIGFHNPESNGLIDRAANAVIHPCILAEDTFFQYLKYENNFKKNLEKIEIKKETFDSDDLIKILQDNPSMYPSIKKIDVTDIGDIYIIFNKMLEISKEHQLPLQHIFVCTEAKLPKKFRERMEESYCKFRNKDLANKDIYDAIYDISLCTMIYNNRRRLLYNREAQDVFKNELLFNNVYSYVETLKGLELITKYGIFNEKYTIYGEMDLINVTNKKVIDFKCSDSDHFNFDWLVQLLAYTALLRLSTDKTINTIEVYNPIRGILFSMDVQTWNKEEELLKFMDMVRSRQGGPIQTPESLKPIKRKMSSDWNQIIKSLSNDSYSDVCNSDSDSHDWFVENLIQHYLKHKEPQCLKLLKQFYDSNKKVASPTILKNIVNLLPMTYIVIDTETTGLPSTRNFNNFFSYQDTQKYDTSRVVQISWQIHNNQKIEPLISRDFIIKPVGFAICNSFVHGITPQKAVKEGYDLVEVLGILMQDLLSVDTIVAHNIKFDVNVLKSEAYRLGLQEIIDEIDKKRFVCTLEVARQLKQQKQIKSCKLALLYQHLFGEEMTNAHNAKYDVMYTSKVFQRMKELGMIII